MKNLTDRSGPRRPNIPKYQQIRRVPPPPRFAVGDDTAAGGSPQGGSIVLLNRIQGPVRARAGENRFGRGRFATGALFVGLLFAGGLWTTHGQGSDAASSPYVATTCREARDAAVQQIPFERLSPAAREKVSSILSTTSLFRRTPVHVTPCDPEMYLFLVRHPDVVVNIWEELQISDLRMQEVSPSVYRVTDGESTVCKIEYLYRDHETHIVYGEGHYSGPLLAKPVHGKSLVILRTGYAREPDGRYYVSSRLDTFTQIDDVGVEFITRTFQPVIGKIADSNFLQTSAFVGSLSRTAELNYRGVQRLAGNLGRVQPELRREFAILAKRIADKPTRQASHERPLDAPTEAKRTGATPKLR